MLVVCALALVVAAAVYLVMGLVDGAVGDLYLSMVLCGASLLVLAVSARVSRSRPPAAASEPPAPDAAPIEAPTEEATDWSDPPPPPRRASRPEPASTPGLATAAVGTVVLEKEDEEPAPLVEADAEPRPDVEPASMWAPIGADPFPIADYDTLEAAQVLPLIGRLWPEEIPVVVARERATKARPAVLDALAAEAGDASYAFPIAEYASLDTAQITRLLERLDTADLEVVRSAERSGDARVGVLVAVANELAARG